MYLWKIFSVLDISSRTAPYLQIASAEHALLAQEGREGGAININKCSEGERVKKPATCTFSSLIFHIMFCVESQ